MLWVTFCIRDHWDIGLNISLTWGLPHSFIKLNICNHGLRTPGQKIAFTERPKIHSHSQIFRYGRSIFCLPHRPKFSDFFDLCLHWVSVVRGYWYSNVKNFKSLTCFRRYHGLQTSNEGIIQKKKSENLGRCDKQNILWQYLKIWEWELIVCHTVTTISSRGLRSTWAIQ